MDIFQDLIENINYNLKVADDCQNVQAKRSMVQRARGVWNFGLYLIRQGKLVLLETEQYDYDALDKKIFDADHALDGK